MIEPDRPKGLLETVVDGMMARFNNPKVAEQPRAVGETPQAPSLIIEATCIVIHLGGLYSAFNDPGEEIRFVNAYLNIANPIIHNNTGTIEEIHSHDATKAFFGVYPGQSDPVLRAMTAAVELRHALADFREVKSDVHIGIGVNTGEVFYGNIGSPDRFDFGIFGNNVRDCFRFAESASTNRDSNLLIGARTFQALPENYLRAKSIRVRTPIGRIKAYAVFGLQES